MLLNDHGSVSPAVPTEGLREELAWWSLALHRQPTGPRTQLGTPPTPGARARPCGANRTPGLRRGPALPQGTSGSREALPLHRGTSGSGEALPVHRRPCPHVEALPVHKGTLGSHGRPARPPGEPRVHVEAPQAPARTRPASRHTSLVPAAATPQFRTARTQRLPELRGRVPAVSNSPR